MARRVSLILLLFLLPLAGLLAKDVPYLAGRVNDQANLIPVDQRQKIEAQLAQLEKETGDQVVVLTVDSLEGEAIEDYAHKVAQTWALGQKGKNNGALLLVSKQDRKMRIEVGYGLEPVLTDIQTNLIQTQIIIPHFKQGDYGGGIAAGVDAILTSIQGKPVQVPAPEARPSGGGEQGVPWPGFLFFLVFLGPFLLNAIRSGSWVLYIIMLPILFFLGLLASPIVGFIAAGAWLVLFPILRMILPRTPSSGRFGGRRGGGWWIGPGMGGGGGWGGGGGGGGFSGGGGSFGGGGSSSSW